MEGKPKYKTSLSLPEGVYEVFGTYNCASKYVKLHAQKHIINKQTHQTHSYSRTNTRKTYKCIACIHSNKYAYTDRHSSSNIHLQLHLHPWNLQTKMHLYPCVCMRLYSHVCACMRACVCAYVCRCRYLYYMHM